MSPLPDLCIRCGKAYPDQAGDWLHCEECYQIVCNEIHEAEAQARPVLVKVPADLLLRVVRGRVPSLQMERGHWRGDCPWCEQDRSLYVYPERNHYHCYGCGQDGDAIQFLMKDEELRFIDATLWLAKIAGVAA